MYFKLTAIFAIFMSLLMPQVASLKSTSDPCRRLKRLCRQHLRTNENGIGQTDIEDEAVLCLQEHVLDDTRWTRCDLDFEGIVESFNKKVDILETKLSQKDLDLKRIVESLNKKLETKLRQKDLELKGIVESLDKKVDVLETKLSQQVSENEAKRVVLEVSTHNQMSEVKTKLGNLESVTANQSLVLADLHKKVSENNARCLALITNHSQAIKQVDSMRVSENNARYLELEELSRNQNQAINRVDERVSENEAKHVVLEVSTHNQMSEVKTKLGNLETFTANQSLVLADLHKKGTIASMFRAGYHKNDTLVKNKVMVFRSEYLNIGGDYNPNTGIYTAPVDGLYVFHLAVTTESGVKHINVVMRANGRVVARLFVRDKSYEDHSSVSTAVRLDKGHQVKALVVYTTTDTAYGSHNSAFTGFLLQTL